jgi:hypothetical protein
VVQNVGLRFHHDFHGRLRTLEIGHQHFHAAIRNAFADRADRQRKQLRSAVFAIVPVHAGDHGILQSKDFARLGNAARFVVIHRQRRAFLHRAETTAARADVAQNHERGRAAVPAFAYIRTGGALAHRVEFQVCDQLLELTVILSNRGRRAQPRRALGFGSNCN